MKKYKSLFKERRIREYKAWANPDNNYFFQFSLNRIHSEIAEEELFMSEEEAINLGYARIYVGNEVNIDTAKTPTPREFNTIKYMIEENSYKKFSATRWKPYDQKGMFFFPNQSFLFADEIEDGELKVF
jgi:hypothetical protein